MMFIDHDITSVGEHTGFYLHRLWTSLWEGHESQALMWLPRRARSFPMEKVRKNDPSDPSKDDTDPPVTSVIVNRACRCSRDKHKHGIRIYVARTRHSHDRRDQNRLAKRDLLSPSLPVQQEGPRESGNTLASKVWCKLLTLALMKNEH